MHHFTQKPELVSNILSKIVLKDSRLILGWDKYRHKHVTYVDKHQYNVQQTWIKNQNFLCLWSTENPLLCWFSLSIYLSIDTQKSVICEQLPVSQRKFCKSRVSAVDDSSFRYLGSSTQPGLTRLIYRFPSINKQGYEFVNLTNNKRSGLLLWLEPHHQPPPPHALQKKHIHIPGAT